MTDQSLKIISGRVEYNDVLVTLLSAVYYVRGEASRRGVQPAWVLLFTSRHGA